ncbi:MAG: deoxyribonuclease IV, partial [Chloroflexota bacterium]|nr:deoxyribonuclease IV [Chloroflexota bacterium]
MTIDFGAHVSAAGGLDLALTRANDFGMAACQVFTKSERQWAAKPLDPAIVQRFHEYAAVYEIKHLVAHDSYLINIASPNDELREKSIAALIHELERCDALNIPHLVSHPGAHMGEGPDYGVDRVADAINRIHAAMPEGRAIILIETTAGQGTAMGRSFDEIGAMIDLLVDKSRIGVCMD